jgi:hypothetical protein
MDARVCLNTGGILEVCSIKIICKYRRLLSLRIKVLPDESQPTFRRNMSYPTSRLKNKPSKKPAWGKQQLFNPEEEAACSSETSVDVQQRRECRTLHNHAIGTSNYMGISFEGSSVILEAVVVWVATPYNLVDGCFSGTCSRVRHHQVVTSVPTSSVLSY